MPRVTVNGQEREVAAGTDVAALVRELTGHDDPSGVAVAVNREVVPRSRWHERRLRPGDTLEVIVPRGGG